MLHFLCSEFKPNAENSFAFQFSCIFRSRQFVPILKRFCFMLNFAHVHCLFIWWRKGFILHVKWQKMQTTPKEFSKHRMIKSVEWNNFQVFDFTRIFYNLKSCMPKICIHHIFIMGPLPFPLMSFLSSLCMQGAQCSGIMQNSVNKMSNIAFDPVLCDVFMSWCLVRCAAGKSYNYLLM